MTLGLFTFANIVSFVFFFGGLIGFVWAQEIDLMKDRKNKLNQKVGCVLLNMYSVIAVILFVIFAFPHMSESLWYGSTQTKVFSIMGMLFSLAGLGTIIYKIMEEKE